MRTPSSRPWLRAPLALCALVAIACGGASEPDVAALASPHACDERAAHPKDPERMAPGVPLDAIVPRPALQACEDALGDHPDAGRFHYQHGRALVAAERFAEARESYERAAAMGHAAAFQGLGWLYADGDGVAADAELAAEHFRKAIAGGFPAEPSLHAVVFSAEGYGDGALLESIYAGQPLTTGALERSGGYLDAFVTAAAETCGPRISNRAAVALTSTVQGQVFRKTFERILGAGGRAGRGGDPVAEGRAAGSDLVQGLAALSDAGRGDFAIFAERHGCDTPVAKRFYANLDRALRP